MAVQGERQRAIPADCMESNASSRPGKTYVKHAMQQIYLIVVLPSLEEDINRTQPIMDVVIER